MVKLVGIILIVYLLNSIQFEETLGLTNIKYKRPKYYFNFKGIKCISGEANITCIVKPVRHKFGQFFTRITYKQEVHQMFVDAEILTKSSSNIYYPTGLKLKQEYCSTIGNKAMRKLADTLFPLTDGYRVTDIPAPTCPLKGTYEHNYTAPLILLDPNFVPSGDHRWDVTYRMANGKLLYKNELSVYANAASFRKT